MPVVVSLERVEIVLVRPARPANVAAACRAMKNMGLGRLRLVEPPPGLEAPEARALAYGAWDVLDAASVESSLRDAVSGSLLVVGTSGRASAESWTPREFAASAETRAMGGRISIVFGPEASGLRNDELDLCQARVHIPTAADHSSLNLAQAVLILGYEIFLAASRDAPRVPSQQRATAGEIEEALDGLREGLLGIGFLNEENPGAILAEARRWIARSAPTRREITLLRGVGRQVEWAARVIARSRRGTP
jgi:tRNA (cytidine32/uridine32-2'-O)-methyltransferase